MAKILMCCVEHWNKENLENQNQAGIGEIPTTSLRSNSILAVCIYITGRSEYGNHVALDERWCGKQNGLPGKLTP